MVDLIPLCTTEFTTCGKCRDEFAAIDTALPGVSIDSHYSHIARLLPDETRIFVGRDYVPGRAAQCEATVAGNKAANIHRRAVPTGADYRGLRGARDATLPLAT